MYLFLSPFRRAARKRLNAHAAHCTYPILAIADHPALYAVDRCYGNGPMRWERTEPDRGPVEFSNSHVPQPTGDPEWLLLRCIRQRSMSAIRDHVASRCTRDQFRCLCRRDAFRLVVLPDQLRTADPYRNPDLLERTGATHPDFLQTREQRQSILYHIDPITISGPSVGIE